MNAIYRFVVCVKGWTNHPQLRLQVINAHCRTAFGSAQNYCYSCKLTFDLRHANVDEEKAAAAAATAGGGVGEAKSQDEKTQAWKCARRIYVYHDEWQELRQRLTEVASCIPSSVCKCFKGSGFSCSYLF
ncbi:unnamed protein product [Heterosigma akashiwo]